MRSLLRDDYKDAVVGQPPEPTCLLAGLLYLKYTLALSDEELIAHYRPGNEIFSCSIAYGLAFKVLANTLWRLLQFTQMADRCLL